MKNLSILKRGGIFLLAMVMAVTFIPIFGPAPAFASDDQYAESEEVVDVLSKDQKKAEKDKAEAKVRAEMGVMDDEGAGADVAEADVTAADIEEASVAEDEESSVYEIVPAQPADRNAAPEIVEERSMADAHISSDSADGEASLQGEDLPDRENFKVNAFLIYTNGDVEISAEVDEPGWTFSRMCMDNSQNTIRGTNIKGLSSFTEEFNLKDYGIGYHTFILRFCYNGEEVTPYFYWEYLPRLIYDEVPSIQYSDFITGPSYFKYYNNGNRYSEDNSCGVSIEYKKGSESWKMGPALVDTYNEKGKGGLRAATAYSVRASFCKQVIYNDDGKTYLFQGPVSRTLTIKTAYSKPPVKSVKISKVKVKCKKYRYWTGKIRQKWLVNSRTGRKIKLISQKKIYRTVKYYSTRYKVTVKFKKKPGIAGIRLRTSHGYSGWLGGNKTSYSKKFVVSGKKKGKKLKVSVRALMSKQYDSWSGTYKKRVKIK